MNTNKSEQLIVVVDENKQLFNQKWSGKSTEIYEKLELVQEIMGESYKSHNVHHLKCAKLLAY